jgi:hypothetical protein
MNKLNPQNIFLVSLLSFSLVACGGGGSDSGSTSKTQTPPPVTGGGDNGGDNGGGTGGGNNGGGTGGGDNGGGTGGGDNGGGDNGGEEPMGDFAIYTDFQSFKLAESGSQIHHITWENAVLPVDVKMSYTINPDTIPQSRVDFEYGVINNYQGGVEDLVDEGDFITLETSNINETGVDMVFKTQAFHAPYEVNGLIELTLTDARGQQKVVKASYELINDSWEKLAMKLKAGYEQLFYRAELFNYEKDIHTPIVFERDFPELELLYTQEYQTAKLINAYLAFDEGVIGGQDNYGSPSIGGELSWFNAKGDMTIAPDEESPVARILKQKSEILDKLEHWKDFPSEAEMMYQLCYVDYTSGSNFDRIPYSYYLHETKKDQTKEPVSSGTWGLDYQQSGYCVSADEKHNTMSIYIGNTGFGYYDKYMKWHFYDEFKLLESTVNVPLIENFEEIKQQYPVENN